MEETYMQLLQEKSELPEGWLRFYVRQPFITAYESDRLVTKKYAQAIDPGLTPYLSILYLQ